MITRAEVAKLGALHAVEPTMLSLYLTVPPSPADLSSLTAQADELIAGAETACRAGQPVAAECRNSVREKLAPCARVSPGYTVAIFACAGSGLLEAITLPCPMPERGVLGIRPHIRPLLAALERCPADNARRAELRARRLADEILAMPPGGLAAVGLPACLAAVSAGAVQTLVVPRDGLVPGYECGRCGALSLDACGCPDWGTAPLPVPDVIEEMVSRTLEDGGEISVICDRSSPPAARLHFPVPRP
jgi:hypothetical protein